VVSHGRVPGLVTLRTMGGGTGKERERTTREVSRDLLGCGSAARLPAAGDRLMTIGLADGVIHSLLGFAQWIAGEWRRASISMGLPLVAPLGAPHPVALAVTPLAAIVTGEPVGPAIARSRAARIAGPLPGAVYCGDMADVAALAFAAKGTAATRSARGPTTTARSGTAVRARRRTARFTTTSSPCTPCRRRTSPEHTSRSTSSLPRSPRTWSARPARSASSGSRSAVSCSTTGGLLPRRSSRRTTARLDLFIERAAVRAPASRSRQRACAP
jgi:hypothetical protein